MWVMTDSFSMLLGNVEAAFPSQSAASLKRVGVAWLRYDEG